MAMNGGRFIIAKPTLLNPPFKPIEAALVDIWRHLLPNLNGLSPPLSALYVALFLS